MGRAFEATTGSATITDNEIVGYQKGGIVVDNTGSTATITGNRVTGAGPTKIIGRNGIQVSRGATATITDNEVRNNFYLNSRAADPGCPFRLARLKKGHGHAPRETVKGEVQVLRSRDCQACRHKAPLGLHQAPGGDRTGRAAPT